MLLIFILPPHCWTKPVTIDRPRPVPLPASLVVKKGSVMRWTISPGIPSPWSLTTIRT
jgi:hypothetical protein